MTQVTDQAIGARIRMYRKALGLSQTDLAGRLGVTFQQIQKYETGANRIAASRLWRIADMLGISVLRLFDDLQFQGEGEAEVFEMLDLYRRLPAEARAQALFQMRALDARHARQPQAPLSRGLQ